MTAHIHPGRARRHTAAVTVGAAVLVCGLAALSLFLGSHTIAPGQVWQVLFGHGADPSLTAIVRVQRVPRALVGIIAGFCLGVATVLIQGLVRNPLAEPGLLGVNSGAAFAVATGIVTGYAGSPFAQLLWAFFGAAVCAVLVLTVGGVFRPNPSPARLILSGVAFSTALSAAGGFLVLNSPETYAEFRHWDAGALSHRPGTLLALSAVVALVATVIALFAARGLDVLAAGTEFATSLGLSTRRTWLLSAGSALALCAVATSLMGPVSFLGLLATMAARSVTRGSFTRSTLLAGCLGSAVLLFADILGRYLVRPDELEAGIVCAMLGGPVFIALALRWHARWKA